MPDLELEPRSISFFVPGVPAPGGSKKFVGFGKRMGKPIIIDAGGQKTTNWRAMVAAVAHENRPKKLLAEPLKVTFGFTMPRPKSHYGTGNKGGTLKVSAPFYHTVAPDVTKLIRSTEDAMKKIIWIDDSQVVDQSAVKLYGDIAGCHVTIEQL